LPNIPGGVTVVDPDDLVAQANRPEHLGAAQQGERRLLLRGGGQQLEEVPLRDEGYVFVRAGDSVQVDVDLRALDLHADRVDLAVRQLRELIRQAQFIEQPQSARVHGVATKVTQKVGVLLHHRDVDAATGEQQSEHDSRRAAAGNNARCVLSLGRHAAIFASNSVAVWAASSTGGTASSCGFPVCRLSRRPRW
jgi:hypothetical protein